MSDRHAAAPQSIIEVVTEIGVLPTSVEAFLAALRGEREKVLAELRPGLEQEVAKQVAAQIETHRQALEAEFEQKVAQEVEAGLAAGIAAGVAEAVQRILEQWRLSRHNLRP